jgi:predicted nucleic acid-binding protein
VRVVVADAGPLHYLLLVEQIELLPRLFGNVMVPGIVLDELLHSSAPRSVRKWAASPPPWIAVAAASPQPDPDLEHLDEGEKAAISLALKIRADLLLMDDRAGVRGARKKGLIVVGTIGVLDLAAARGLIDLGTVVARLRTTNFRYSPRLLDELLSRRSRQKGR